MYLFPSLAVILEKMQIKIHSGSFFCNDGSVFVKAVKRRKATHLPHYVHTIVITFDGLGYMCLQVIDTEVYLLSPVACRRSICNPQSSAIHHDLGLV